MTGHRCNPSPDSGFAVLFSTTTRFCDMKQKRNYSFLTSRSIAKTSFTIRSSVTDGSRFLMIFIVGVKSYMEVSNETPSYTPTNLFSNNSCSIMCTIQICKVILLDKLCCFFLKKLNNSVKMVPSLNIKCKRHHTLHLH